MKKLIIIPLLLLSLVTYSQVKDLPIVFSTKGYILAIDFDQKMIQVDCITTDKNLGAEEVLKSQIFSLSNCEIINDKKAKITLNDLRSSDEILVTGQWFQEKDEYIIQKIVVQSKRAANDLEGKIDLIQGDFAYIDGNKVKLAEGKKIKGDDKTGYKGQIFNSFSEIKKGIYAKVNGKYDDAGYFLAKNFIISPDVETSFDKAALAADKEIYDKIYSTWIDPVKRKLWFGKNVEGVGKITNNEAIQDYVNRVGQKLIPDYIKQQRRVNFIFIVVDNVDVLAYVKANGLAVVYTGLLLNLDNEAQLANVLGHEITHAIYEHQADEKSTMEKAEKKKDLFGKGISLVNAGTDAILKSKKGVEEEKQKEANQLLAGTISDIVDKNVINYSVEQENQSDRVGLFLATLAGYDPKEAPVVWKKLYTQYGKLTRDKDAFDKQITAFKELQNNKEYITKGLANQAVLTALTIKKVDYKTKIIRTHPDELKRYEALNNMIALYWNNPKLLEGATNNQEEYLSMMNKLTQTKAIELPKAAPKMPPKPQPKAAQKKKQ